MTEPNFSVNFTARMLASEACAIGDLLVLRRGGWSLESVDDHEPGGG